MMAQHTPDECFSLLTRLVQKPGVQSTLIISRENGTVIRTSGHISSLSSINEDSALPLSISETENHTKPRKEGDVHTAEDIANLVLAFLTAAGTLMKNLDQDDELKLLRLRTKNSELVIVPDGMYVLVAVYDASPA